MVIRLLVLLVWLPSESGSRSITVLEALGSGTISGSSGFTGQSTSSTITSSAKLLLTASILTKYITLTYHQHTIIHMYVFKIDYIYMLTIKCLWILLTQFVLYDTNSFENIIQISLHFH